MILRPRFASRKSYALTALFRDAADSRHATSRTGFSSDMVLRPREAYKSPAKRRRRHRSVKHSISINKHTIQHNNFEFKIQPCQELSSTSSVATPLDDDRRDDHDEQVSLDDFFLKGIMEDHFLDGKE